VERADDGRAADAVRGRGATDALYGDRLSPIRLAHNRLLPRPDRVRRDPAPGAACLLCPDLGGGGSVQLGTAQGTDDESRQLSVSPAWNGTTPAISCGT